MSVAGPIVHVYERMLAQGGLEGLLEVHRLEDVRAGLDSCFRILFDRGRPLDDPRYHNFDFRWYHPLTTLRRHFRAALPAAPERTLVYHQGWGLPFFAPVDGAVRRVVYLHCDETYFQNFLGSFAGLVDGVICANPQSIETVGRYLPGITPERCCYLPAPVVWPAEFHPKPRPARHEIVLGYPGRVCRAQKRLDRLPDFLAELRRSGVKFRFEVMGAGPDELELRRRLAGQPEVSFLGWRRGTEYWQRLAEWDAAVWFSDWEGVPVALVEAMAVGTLVFYPKLGRSVGDLYAPQLDPRCHYPVGDMAAAAHAVATVCGMGEANMCRLRTTAQALAAPHTSERYTRVFADFLGELSRRERLSRDWTRSKDRAIHRLPLGLVTRLCPGQLRKP